MRAQVTKLALRILVLAAPLIVFVGVYLVNDPWRVLYHHDSLIDARSVVDSNRDFVSSETFLRNVASQKYDSYIFGNSRSLAFHTDDWAPHLTAVKPFHFDASGETIFGVWSKLRYLDRHDFPLRNVLWIADASQLAVTTNVMSPVFIKHYVFSGESWLAFQSHFLSAIFGNFFIIKYIDYKLFGHVRPYMADVFVNDGWRVIPKTNDVIFAEAESEIKAQGDAYWQAQAALFAARTPFAVPGQDVIGARQIEMLTDIVQILARHQSDVRVVISPLWDEVPLTPHDHDALATIFGKSFFDFSGASTITADPHNYYEPSHYRPQVARELLARIYAR